MNEWLRQWFDDGDAILARRARFDVERMASVAEAVQAATARGWHIVETGDQLVLLRHDGIFQILC